MIISRLPSYILVVIVASVCGYLSEASFAKHSDDDAIVIQSDDEAVEDIGLSLDELLGLDEQSNTDEEQSLPDIGQSITEDANQDAPPIAKMFLDAIEAMNKSFEQLQNKGNTGLITQRYQEEAIHKLTILIEQAQKENKKNQQQSTGNKPPTEPGDSPPKQNDSQQQDSQAGENQGTDSRPAGQPGQEGGNISEARMEWGQLPARVREMLIQGRSDKPASMYRKLTETYYKRLADESKDK